MLRTLQTKASSKKIAALFDTLVPAMNMSPQPILVEATQPGDRTSQFTKLCNKPPRRRRTRSHRLVSAPGTLKTSWF